MEDIEGVRTSSGQGATPISPAPDPDALNRIAQELAKANNPLIITGYSGRNPAAVEALTQVAELAGGAGCVIL